MKSLLINTLWGVLALVVTVMLYQASANFIVGEVSVDTSCDYTGTYVYEGPDTRWTISVYGDSWRGDVKDMFGQDLLFLRGNIDGNNISDDDGNFTGEISCGFIELTMTSSARRRYAETMGEQNTMDIMLVKQ